MKCATGFAVFALLLNASITFSQSTPMANFSASYDGEVREVVEKLPDLPGIAIVVIKEDMPIFMKAYGHADREAGRKADTDTLWYMGSSTKSFTAMVAALLDREGKLKLDDPVTKYAGDVKFKVPLPEKITVRNLLTHTSGLQNSALIHRTAFTGQIDKVEIAFVLGEGTTLNDAFFGKYRYTNLGYNIYGLILDNHLKLSWKDEVQKRIFDPAGLKHSTAYISRAPAKKWSVAAPYVFSDEAGGVIRSVLNKVDNNMQAAGGHYMSISDLGRWLNLNMNKGKLAGKQVIPADIINTVHAGYTTSTRNAPPFSGDGEYGLGWQIGKYREDKVIYHHGGYPGYRSHVSFMPERRLAVGVLVNNDHIGGWVADSLAAYAYDTLLARPDTDAAFTKQLGDFVELYTKRKQQAIAAAAERAKRPSQLTQPLRDYTGKYLNELFGTIEISEDGKYLTARMGHMFAAATPFTEKDSIRVVMQPGGNGEVIKFVRGADGKFGTLNYNGVIFARGPG